MNILFNNVSFSYGKGDVFKDLSINLEGNKVLALLGENGIGKSTFGKLCMGIIHCNEGDITVDGKNIKEIPLWEIGKSIGYLFQNPRLQLFASTVLEEMLFPYHLSGRINEEVLERCQELLGFFGLIHVQDNTCYNLSIGEKQRLALAAILMNRPRYMILDEPTTGLDNLNRGLLLKKLKSLKNDGIGMLIISHDQEFLKELQDNKLIIEGNTVKEIFL